MRRTMTLAVLILLATGLSLRPQAAPAAFIVQQGYGATEVWNQLRAGFEETSGHRLAGSPSAPTQVLLQLTAKPPASTADCLLLPGTSAVLATREGLFEPYNPVGLATVPAGYRDRGGHWFTVHIATVALVVHQGALGKVTLPGSWQDLGRPPFRGQVAYEDPRGGGSGYTFLFGINQLLGGSAEDLEPGLAYLKELHQNGARALSPAVAESALAKGEIGVWIGLDADGYRLRESGAPVRVIIPRDGSFKHLTVAGLASAAPHPEAAKRYLDWLIEPTTQGLLAGTYLQPILLSATPAEIARNKLPASHYARVRNLPLPTMADTFSTLTAAWQEHFGGG